ncbi:UNVERIFIED_CONTAM: Dihydrodipicolinate reductase-like protein CRR1, chloroplastic [Sesamum calycinum]|uniref:Dihydrodipicolinate reductase-like protein CRR1, chloroplastic n=1 Tax=Sesamum calycinum TaxID=2727403 RepID=A0AAW2JFP4_9LAMI
MSRRGRSVESHSSCMMRKLNKTELPVFLIITIHGSCIKLQTPSRTLQMYQENSVHFLLHAAASQTNIKVIINGAAKEIGRAAVVAVTKARGMEVAGAIDSYLVGEDIGKSKASAVVVDFTDPSTVYDNVKQGCIVAPTLSIGSILLQQAAISASFHYNNVEIVESRPAPALARGQVVGEDGVRVHSMVLPGLPSSQTQSIFPGQARYAHEKYDFYYGYLLQPKEVYTLKHDITDVQSLMPGLLLAIRRVVRLKNLVYGLEKLL